MRPLDDLVRQGKILQIGLSDTPAWVVSKGNAIAQLRGWTAVSAIQNQTSTFTKPVPHHFIELEMYHAVVDGESAIAVEVKECGETTGFLKLLVYLRTVILCGIVCFVICQLMNNA